MPGHVFEACEYQLTQGHGQQYHHEKLSSSPYYGTSQSDKTEALKGPRKISYYTFCRLWSLLYEAPKYTWRHSSPNAATVFIYSYI